MNHIKCQHYAMEKSGNGLNAVATVHSSCNQEILVFDQHQMAPILTQFQLFKIYKF
jgi:phage gp29-like protein